MSGLGAMLVASWVAETDFLPHGYCYLWNRPLLWTHVISDVLIGMSYVVISVSLVVLMRRVRHEVPFSGIFIAFGTFIIACGLTHFMEVWTLWQARYWLAGGVKVVTAVASVTTALIVPFMVPRIQAAVQNAKHAHANDIAAERAATLEESNEELQQQAVELEQQIEEAQQLATELGEANQALQEALQSARASRDESEQARQQLASVIGGMADGYIAVDREWRIRSRNQRILPMGQTPDAEKIGRILWEEWPGLIGTVFERQYRNAMEIGEAIHFEAWYSDLQVGERWFEVDVYPAENVGLNIFYRDITKRHEIAEERELLLNAERRARTEADRQRHGAEMANASKSRFLAAMSHELRTPLNAICGYVDLLLLELRGPVTADQRTDLNRIRTNQQHLLRLINDVLDFTTLDAGQLSYRMTDVPLDATLRAAEAMVMPQIQANGLIYVYEGCDASWAVYADRDKVQQIVLNLLGNAIKFTPCGGQIRITCARDTTMMRIRVADTGPGIPEDKLQAIFDPFVQVDRQLNQPVNGIGLGLAISRELAHRMGGNLTVQSVLGGGSIFTLVLAIGRQPMAPMTKDPLMESLRITSF